MFGSIYFIFWQTFAKIKTSVVTLILKSQVHQKTSIQSLSTHPNADEKFQQPSPEQLQQLEPYLKPKRELNPASCLHELDRLLLLTTDPNQLHANSDAITFNCALSTLTINNTYKYIVSLHVSFQINLGFWITHSFCYESPEMFQGLLTFRGKQKRRQTEISAPG